MKKIHAFCLGIKEFKRSFTTHFGPSLINYYDAGRELAHLFTFRFFEK
jgi:hypothetical protein